jgi:DNA-binding NarL/FixJ family response regulator
MPTILIVDDHHAARITLRELLDWHSFQVCGDAQNGKEAIEKVLELKPDIVLLDINMPVMDGIAAATEIRRIAPLTKIVFLTVNDAPAFQFGMKPWAHGFVSKSTAGTELIPTLHRVARTTANEMGGPFVTKGHMAVEQKSSETRRGEILQAEIRHAADSRDGAGICTAYVKTALQLLIEFPDMSPEEKQFHYDCLKGDIERQRVQAHQDCSKVLGELRRILD